MFERLTQPFKEAAHLTACFVDLGRMALSELVHIVNEAEDCWGDDTPEDAAIPSSINQERAA